VQNVCTPAKKEIYASCQEAVVPQLGPGALLMADNAMSCQSDLQSMLDAALLDPRVDALVVTIGTVELICRKRQTKRHNPHPAARMLAGLAGPDRERRPPSDPRDLTVLILRDVNIGTTTNVSEAVALPLPLRTTQAESQMLTTSGYGDVQEADVDRAPARLRLRRPQGERRAPRCRSAAASAHERPVGPVR
jgi:hypothetical protein